MGVFPLLFLCKQGALVASASKNHVALVKVDKVTLDMQTMFS